MKRSDFVKKVLKSRSNTVFVNEEQVINAMTVFESLGMLPPVIERDFGIYYEGGTTTEKVSSWEEE